MKAVVKHKDETAFEGLLCSPKPQEQLQGLWRSPGRMGFDLPWKWEVTQYTAVLLTFKKVISAHTHFNCPKSITLNVNFTLLRRNIYHSTQLDG